MKGLGSPYNALFSCNGKKVLKYPYFHINLHSADALASEESRAEYQIRLCDKSSPSCLFLVSVMLEDAIYFSRLMYDSVKNPSTNINRFQL